MADWSKIYPCLKGLGKPVNLDDSSENADWTKQSWDLPPYGSTEFFQAVPLDLLEEFKKSATYKNAVGKGLIMDDEWMGDIKPVES